MEFHFSAINTSNQNPSPTTSSNKRKGRSYGSNGRYSSMAPGSTAVKLSTDPQSVAARERRHRISNRFKILQTMVPGGTKMDTVSMLDEAIHYVKFLKAQVWLHQNMMVFFNETTSSSTTTSYSSDDDIAAVATRSSRDFVSRCVTDSAPVMETYSQLMPPTDSWFGSADQETVP